MGDLSDAYEYLERKVGSQVEGIAGFTAAVEANMKAFLAGRARMDIDPMALNMEYEIEMKLVPRRRALNDEAIGALKKLHGSGQLPGPFQVG